MEMDDIWKRYYKVIGDLRMFKFRRVEEVVELGIEMEEEWLKWWEEIKIVLC